MAAEAPDTWRSKLSGSADRRGIPLGTIVTSAVVVIGLVDLNAAVIIGLWSLRTIVVYAVIAFFITLLLTPATRFLRARGMSHGGATLLVFLVGALVLIGLVATWAGIVLAYDSYDWPPARQGWPVSFFVVSLVLATYLLAQLGGRRRARATRG